RPSGRGGTLSDDGRETRAGRARLPPRPPGPCWRRPENGGPAAALARPGSSQGEIRGQEGQMPRLRVGFLVAIAVLALGIEPADAGGVVHAYWHGHWGPHVFIGPGPFWYPPPYVGPPAVVQPASPAQVHAQPPMPAQPDWHSCGK